MISLLVVNYRSAALAAEAIQSARASSSVPLQIVVVDNSEDPAEAAALQGLADRLVISDTNRGYAGGINLGRPACEAETIVISNPDVTFGEGAIDRLHEALGSAAAAGPALFWDSAEKWMLPPGDRSTALEKMDTIMAGRSASWREQRERRRILRRVAFWSLRRTSRVETLSGAVLAVRASDFDAAGGFDERFRLYFEETDFLRRLAAMRKKIVYLPGAHCRHLFNQSAGQRPDLASERYAESELKYLEKWNGPFLARAIKRFERRFEPLPADRLEGPLVIDREGLLVEASPLPAFETAAGHFPESGAIDIPASIWEAFRGNVLHVRTVERQTGKVLASYARYRS
jgi:GT2 family glycosyltransferase